MSLYNMINGVNQATFYILPMLGEKHPDLYPRFRDCFVRKNDKDFEIHVYTRVGGNNRGQGYGEEELLKHPNYLRDFDDDEDSTYATYVFSVPEEWKQDFEKIVEGELLDVSSEYQQRLKIVYPKLATQFDSIFNGSK